MNIIRKKFILSALPVIALSFVGVAIGMLVAPTVTHAKHFVHQPSGKCIAPYKNSGTGGTKLVLHSDGCRSPGDNGKPLHFRFDDINGRVIHHASGLCMVPENWQRPVNNQTRLVLDSCDVAAAEFGWYRHKSLRHMPSGKCVHIKLGGGDDAVNAHDNAELMLYAGCLGERLAFAEVIPAAKRSSYNVPRHATKLVHRYSGLCATLNRYQTDNNTEIKLRPESCEARSEDLNFMLTNTGAIKHIKTGKCVHPKGNSARPGDNTRLVLYDGCTLERIRFEYSQTTGILTHLTSGKCVRPDGASLVPNTDTRMVLHKDCNAGMAIAFDFIPDE